MRERPYTGRFPFAYNLDSIQYLEFHISTILGNLDLDRLMCGISYEELKELKGKDVEFLKKLHIVPTEPGIIHLPNLKILKLVPRGAILPTVSGIVSRVAAGICYSRIPGLILQLELAVDPSSRRGAEEMIQELLAKMKDFPEVNTRTKIVDAGMASYVVRML